MCATMMSIINRTVLNEEERARVVNGALQMDRGTGTWTGEEEGVAATE